MDEFKAAAAPKKEEPAKVGKAAPDFTLKDTDGKEVKLSELKGKIVILHWINPGCGVSGRVLKDAVGPMLKAVKAIKDDVVHLPISSAGAEAKVVADHLSEAKVEAKGLLDDGKVAKLYGAETTPHVFVIDGEGVLRYAGAFDDDPFGKKGESAKNYIVPAVKAIVDGKKVSPETTKPYGTALRK